MWLYNTLRLLHVIHVILRCHHKIGLWNYWNIWLACRILGCLVFSKRICLWVMGKDAMPYFTIWVPSLLFTSVRVLKCVSPYYQHTLLSKYISFLSIEGSLCLWTIQRKVKWFDTSNQHWKTHLKGKKRERRKSSSTILHNGKGISHIRTRVLNLHSICMARWWLMVNQLTPKGIH